MKKAIAVFVVILAGTLCVLAQDTTFLVHYDSIQNGQDGLLHDIEQLPDGGYLLAGLQSTNPFGRLHIFLRKVDSVGNILLQNELYSGQDVTYNMGLFDPLVRTDSGFAGVVSKYDHTVPYASALWFNQYDLNGDTVYTKPILEFTTADSTFVQHWGSTAMPDGGFAVAGAIDEIDWLAEALIIRLDTDGDTLWTKRFTDPNVLMEAYSIAANFDSGVLWSGSRRTGSPVNRNILVRLDSAGNQLWSRQFGNRGGSWNSVRLCPDSTIATWSNYEEQSWPQVDVAAELRKWDQNGNLIWSTITHRTNGRTSTDFEVLPDGSFITVQEWGISMYLSKYSAMGDSLWSRWYRVFDGINAYGNIPYDVDIASDGGFLIAGEAEQGVGDPTNNLQTWYIIKTDSLGCILPGCDSTGVGITEQVTNLSDAITIYPNPVRAGGNFTVEISLPEHYQGEVLQLSMVNSLGQRVYSSSAPINQEPLTINSPSATGMYYLHLTSGSKWLSGTKLMVE